MSDQSVVLLEEQYLAAANELRECTILRKQLDEREAAAKEILRSILQAGDTAIDADGVALVTVKRGAAIWNEKLAREVLPAAQLSAITVTVTEERLDKQKAKDTLAPAIYEACCKRNTDSIQAVL